MKARVAILGAGPAGLSAALWAHNLGLLPLVLERTERTGGNQNLNFLPNKSVLGQDGPTGPELARRFHAHARASGVDIRTGVHLERIARGEGGGGFVLYPAHGGADAAMPCAALVIATGTAYRGTEVLAGVPGFAELAAERVACGPFAFVGLEALRGKSVLIVGGGDNAFENASLLLAVGATVIVATRSQPRAQAAFMGPVLAHGQAEVLADSRPLRLAAAGERIAARLATPGGEREVVVDRIHVLAGYQPNSTEPAALLLAGTGERLQTDDAGYVRVDAWGRTGIAGVYAAGDVCEVDFPCVVSALAGGARAAKIIERDLREAGDR
ncbi:NAD(P)/FAD-dependent oxidoreductase [Pseudothauera rhizosphaerae]|nr:NAD(P)/FAD-dependent oxidoreductase [Pseudothauera rhizosphaerae]